MVQTEPRRSRLLVLPAASVFGVFLALFATSAPVAAECVQFDRWPSFRESAPRASRIVVGEVVAALSTDSADNAIGFRLKVQEVLRGTAPSSMRFDGIRSPGPLECRDSVLRLHVGDIIALAFQSQEGSAVRAVAFIRGRPNRDFLPGMERLTLADVRHVASQLPETDAGGADAQSPGDSSSAVRSVVLLLLAAAFAATMTGRRLLRKQLA